MPRRSLLNSQVNQALDTLYAKRAAPMLKRIAALSKAPGKMQASLKRLDEESQRLVDAEQRMAVNNPVLRQTIGDYQDLLDEAASLIEHNDSALQESAVSLAVIALTAKVFVDLSSQRSDPLSASALTFYKRELVSLGLAWAFPDSLDFAKNYVESQAWIDRLDKWGAGYAKLSESSVLKAIQKGAGPRAVASQMRQYAENIPRSAAESLTRTLQLTSYREASLAMEKINGEFIDYKVRIAELDDRTCLSCVALHGTRLEPGERVDDHYNGRCTEIYAVPGANLPNFMQADSTPGNRNFVPFQTGVDWFNSLTPERQAQQDSFRTSPAKLAAFRSGVSLNEFVGEHTDSVFGRQVVESSLIDAVGAQKAQEFYT